MKVPFLDLNAHHRPHMDEFRRAIDEVIESNAFAGGKYVEQFEAKFAEYCGAKHALGVANGTEAIWAALLGVGVGHGDEVITVSSTFMATVEAITRCGATPVFVDVDESTYTMDSSLVEAAITEKTKAIVPVHLFGQMADMDPILEIARKHGLAVVEDAAQAQGAKYKGREAGSLGDAAGFSFYPGKNLGAFGEAGAVTTNRDDVADYVRLLRDHGQRKKYDHVMDGWNSRMDGIQGAVLEIKLRYLDKSNALRRQHSVRYSELLKGLPLVTPSVPDYSDPVFHIYAVRIKSRDAVLKQMAENGVACGIHYPVPVHLQKAYEHLGWKQGALPVSERIAAEFLSLPMFPELTDEQIEVVASTLGECVKKDSEKPIEVTA